MVFFLATVRDALNKFKLKKMAKKYKSEKYKLWRAKSAKKPNLRLDLKYEGYKTFTRYIISRFRNVEKAISNITSRKPFVCWVLNELRPDGSYTQIKKSSSIKKNNEKNMSNYKFKQEGEVPILVLNTKFYDNTKFENGMKSEIYASKVKKEFNLKREPTEQECFFYAIIFIHRCILIDKYLSLTILDISVFKQNKPKIAFEIYKRENKLHLQPISSNTLYNEWFVCYESESKFNIDEAIKEKIKLYESIENIKNIEGTLERLFCYQNLTDFQETMQKLCDFSKTISTQEEWKAYRKKKYNQFKTSNIEQDKFLLSAVILDDVLNFNPTDDTKTN